jgi:hypothetical protein
VAGIEMTIDARLCGNMETDYKFKIAKQQIAYWKKNKILQPMR